MIPPIVFAKYRRADTLQRKLITQVDKLNPCLELAIPSVFGFSVFYFVVGVGLASMTLLLGATLSSAVAQMPSVPERMPLNETTMSQVNVLFVNPSVGDDTRGNGSQSTPVKTITQALRLATANTVIQLATGTYSAETGEVFPLILKPGVSIQGDAANKGRGITIQGGGEYLSRSFGGQNVTIVGATQGRLTGVTVTNSNPRGYGLWIESSNPVITENTFTGNTQDGISVAGKGAPTISKNYFYRNGANGITIGGNSQPQVRENVFVETGFGINITQNAAPVVVGNQIQNNRSGILVQANARPILRNNLIQDSKEDGLVALAQAMPDLGNANEVGANEFRNNSRYDINASAAKQVIAASGNTLDSDRIAGKVDLNPKATSVANNSITAALPNTKIPEIPASQEISFSAPTQSDTTDNTTGASALRGFPPLKQLAFNNSQLLPLQPAVVPLPTPTHNQKPPTSTVEGLGGFPVPSSLTAREIPPNTQVPSTGKIAPLPAIKPETAQLNYVHIDPKTIEFVAPDSVAQPPSNPTILGGIPQTPVQSDTSILPVPNGNIPIGNTRNMRKVPITQTYTTAYGGSYPPPTRSKQMGVRYRVVVETPTEKEQDLVRLFAPGAFPTIWQGQRVMQAGVFSNRYNADEMLKKLNSNGLRSRIEQLN
ncbi:DUF1565 domain-containing protein [Nostoc sp. CENA67]|uniref:DUF1565 domain-containing protein n=1 Tax=Amazonocrinis nigriterrae CENA67 TaxID=2794033 RepID=A0A8J7HRK4_9NOST|nr:DUF1565 domain-containing protein [Amazonocrinis nigriterrae]MBH8561114.1 DUF1565 domain-containing protein [Amazonocrinis nigriterrae CENA67]